MNILCLDIVNSDRHDWRGTGKDEDRLLKPEWVEQLVARWGFPVTSSPDTRTLAALQSLRSLIQHMVQAFSQQHVPSEQDIAALNIYLNAATYNLHLVREDEHYQLQQVPLQSDWPRILCEIASSFATLLAQHDPARIKQCENPDCRWVYYDESPYQSRRWCEASCANLMRVRRFRARHRETDHLKTTREESKGGV